MDDEWFADKFEEIASRLSVIETSTTETNGKVKQNVKDIRTLQDAQLVKEAEAKFHKKHPIVTAGGLTFGGVSIVTLIGLVVKVIIDMGVFG